MVSIMIYLIKLATTTKEKDRYRLKDFWWFDL